MAALLRSLSSRLAVSILLGIVFATTVSAAPSRPTGGKSSSGAAKALYFIANDEANAVVALKVGADGLLSTGSVTPTNGAGSVALGANMQPATPDALVSQSALTIAGNSLFAVNAGSNTLSMLSIDPADPTRLSLVGIPVPIPGEFPNTVAASAKHNLVCVGTTGALSGISCTNFSPTRGLGPMDVLRSFDLNQTTPPVGPTNTVSQVFFSSDESALFTTVKGDPPTNKTGFLSSFPVQKRTKNCKGSAPSAATLSTKETRSVPSGTAVLFGSQSIPGTNRVFATDASFGAALLSIDTSTGQATTLATGSVQGQVATCWVTLSPATGTAFVTDVGVNRLVEMSLDDAKVLSELDLSANGDPGLIDLRAAGNFVYALSPGNGSTPAAVTVVDVSGGSGTARQAQHFELGGMAGRNSMGMAVWG
ncbi:hypothetical protein B0T14DRAFT_428951 [Immersiella caudata]|uniref:3-carboxymuconate cyclase n=1 Tax=Immersiella caudata TaxID=314043 RepID=A0AA39WVG8_9PEZI|nr:hypothetical protein B0T14DRAFT_428951 [Immersiella caudata]